MINHVTVYRKDTGEIVQYSAFSCEDGDYFGEADNINARLDFFGSDPHGIILEPCERFSQYVTFAQGEPLIVDRPVLRVSLSKPTLVANGTDSIILSGLPNPCTVIQDPGEPEEGVITLPGEASFSQPRTLEHINSGLIASPSSPWIWSSLRHDEFELRPRSLVERRWKFGGESERIGLTKKRKR